MVSLLGQQIERARERAAGLDLEALVLASRGRPPRELATPEVLDDRRRLLEQTEGDRALGDLAFERLIDGDELQPVNALQRGAVAARPVCRLSLVDPSGAPAGHATAFLVAPGVLITNNHVFPAAAAARRSLAEFDLELDVFDHPKPPAVFELQPDRLFHTSAALDFAIVAVAPVSREGVPLAAYGYLPLIAVPGKAAEGEWLTIVQHPGGGQKQVCIRENKLLARTDDVLWYSTDTQGGSSGSPVFNNDWQVVALHHKGVPETRNGVIQTLDGRDFDPARDGETAIKWIANEGIRISRLVDDLKRIDPGNPMLEPVLAMSPQRAREVADALAAAFPWTAGHPAAHTPEARTPAMPRSISLTLDIADDGRVALRQPAAPSASFERTAAAAPARPPAPPPALDVPFDPDYAPAGKRKGYQPDFLGRGFVVPLPELGALAADATPLIGAAPGDPPVLHYRGYSLVMHRTRKLAIYTAANVDGSHRHQLRRPHDEWRYDPRIPRTAQIGAYYYAGNQFDRGHLTRYEDMEFGATVPDALASAADTLHWTNCSPQHARFNEARQFWQGLEQNVLEQAIAADAFRALVFTGPVLDEGDPVWDRYKDVQYPLRFWKIAVARTAAGKLFAAGFVLDQSEVIAQFGIETDVAVPFSAFKTYQVPIEEIERLTGLAFTYGANRKSRLGDSDPLRPGSPHRRAALARVRVRTTESTAAIAPGPGYIPLESESDLVGF